MDIENLTFINTDSITTGVGEVIIGVVAGVITLIIGYYWFDERQKRKEKLEQEQSKRREEEQDKARIYNWLYDKTKHLKPFTVGSPELTDTWPTTVEISSAVDLTEERVHYICTIDNRIQRQEKSDLWPNQKLDERWAVREFVRG